MRGAGVVLGARWGAELLPTKAKPCTLPFREGAARERRPLRLGGSGDGIRRCRDVPGGKRGRGKCLHRAPW